MTDLSTESLQALVDEATPGPWEWEDSTYYDLRSGEAHIVEYLAYEGQWIPRDGDARLIAQAPSLAKEVIALRERVKVLEGALKLNAAILQAEKHRTGGKPLTGTWNIPALGVRHTVSEVLDIADEALKGEQP